MTAEQLLEQMEIFEKAKNDFDEFERSHQSAFKGFLNSFGFLKKRKSKKRFKKGLKKKKRY